MTTVTHTLAALKAERRHSAVVLLDLATVAMNKVAYLSLTEAERDDLQDVCQAVADLSAKIEGED